MKNSIMSVKLSSLQCRTPKLKSGTGNTQLLNYVHDRFGKLVFWELSLCLIISESLLLNNKCA